MSALAREDANCTPARKPRFASEFGSGLHISRSGGSNHILVLAAYSCDLQYDFELHVLFGIIHLFYNARVFQLLDKIVVCCVCLLQISFYVVFCTLEYLLF